MTKLLFYILLKRKTLKHLSLAQVHLTSDVQRGLEACLVTPSQEVFILHSAELPSIKIG